MEEEEMVAATRRLPKSLHAMVAQRARLHRRSFNAELIVLVEKGIDAGVEKDLALINGIKKDPQ